MVEKEPQTTDLCPGLEGTRKAQGLEPRDVTAVLGGPARPPSIVPAPSTLPSTVIFGFLFGGSAFRCAP